MRFRFFAVECVGGVGPLGGGEGVESEEGGAGEGDAFVGGSGDGRGVCQLTSFREVLD